MPRIEELLEFHSSLWGMLTSATILFPTASYFLDAKFLGQSSLKPLYAVSATTISGVAILMLFIYLPTLKEVSRARSTAVLASIVAVLSFFSFVILESVLMDYRSTTSVETAGDLINEDSDRRDGMIRYNKTVKKKDGTSEHSAWEKRDPYDIMALASFDLTVVGFTIAFGALGMHIYANRSDQTSSNALKG